MSADGTGGSQLIPAPAGDNWPTDWTPDDRYIVFTHNDPNTPASIWMVPSDGKGDARPVVESAFEAIGGRVSPDGHWLAYQSKEAGQDEVYVRPFPAAGLPVRVSTAGGTAPYDVTSDGRRLVVITAPPKPNRLGVVLDLFPNPAPLSQRKGH